jgi:hypothetical protein
VTLPRFENSRNMEMATIVAGGEKLTALLGSMPLFRLLINLFQRHPFKNPLLSDEIVALSFEKMAQEAGRAVASSIHRSFDPARHKAEIKEHKAGTRPAVEIRVPSQDLYVMFCQKLDMRCR